MPGMYDRTYYDPLRTFAYERITVAATAVGLTAETFAPTGSGTPAMRAVIQCEDADVRYRTDGTDPTVDEGLRLYAGGDPLVFWGNPDMKLVRFIRIGLANGTVRAEYAR